MCSSDLSLPGQTMDSLADGVLDMAALDRPEQAVRLRLRATAVGLRHLGPPEQAEQVAVRYVDGQGRLRAAALPRIHGPTLVVTQAGNVNTGAVDPVGDVVDATQGTGAWVHVDGAFGLWALASAERRPLLAGVERDRKSTRLNSSH